jgi:hypothetical protein
MWPKADVMVAVVIAVLSVLVVGGLARLTGGHEDPRHSGQRLLVR